jgi:hypothetical protein
VAGRGRSKATRGRWDEALGAALGARAQELVEQLAADGSDAVSRALVDALERARRSGDWSEVAELAGALEAHRRARAAVAVLDPKRTRRR